ncbi:LysM peptidoglycan-binding domain-containing protein [Dethiobacter alkaliphilus]|uniref:LysM peptidoglycan-binding domain-containing protein n=1 Tax=Dethiobacter alkaliphilus TaxID=427926 RepID=UPI0022268E31|nr:LysM peptidoglycan-binding domain-containing protein [Dethiobacter alkaliphilus]MCW3490706.1 LysM peptidoglycan-binding domain-containing protein [Dethiobacter alkaliphilus]
MKTLSAFTARKARSEKKKLKIYRALALLTIWMLIMAFTFFQGNVAMGEVEEPQTVVVSAGDTLWSLAKTHAPGRDIRSYIEQIRDANRLSGSVLHPGQELILP